MKISVLTSIVLIALIVGTQALSLTRNLHLTSFRDDELARHNYYRSLHSVSPLVLSENLNSMAQAWAQHLIDTNTFEHNPNRNGAG